MNAGLLAGPKAEVSAEEAACSLHSYLGFLSDDLVTPELVFGGAEALDSATLEAVCQVAAPSQQQMGGGAAGALLPLALSTSGNTKRLLEECLSDSDDEDELKGDKSGAKKGRIEAKELSAAATKKACREKARREKLNERFQDLARLVDPGGEPKTDKGTILTDAIKYVQQVTVENHQLRQLNKFLEERVSSLERERGQQLYQQSLVMQGMGQGQLMPAGQAMMMGGHMRMMSGMGMGPAQLAMPAPAMAPVGSALMSAAAGCLQPCPTPPLPQMPSQSQPQLLQATSQQLKVEHAQQQSGLQEPGPGQMELMQQQMAGGALGLQQMQQQMTQGGMAGLAGMAVGGMSALGGGAFGGPGPGPSKPMVAMSAVPGVMPFQGLYWLPQPMTDSTQDSLLRPPAA